MSSLFKKINSVAKNGIKPLEKGRKNYQLNIPEIELIASERLKTCLECGNYTEEPISFLKVKDKRLEKLSEKMCNDCGCALPYLLRQSDKICKKWKR